MAKGKGFTTVPLGINRRVVIASASVTRQKNTIHGFTEVDITEPRRRLNEHFQRTGEKLSFTAYIVACLAETMKQFPRFNSFIKGGKLVLLDDVTISVLIEREIAGEKVPEPVGIRQAQSKTYYQIHNEIRNGKEETGEKIGSLSGMNWIRWIPSFLLKAFVRLADRNITMAKKYGKVAVTAVGMYSKEAVWFIPHGSATVLATVGSINYKTVEVDGRFVSREHLCLTLSFDHNIVDGAPAARFINRLAGQIKSGALIDSETGEKGISGEEKPSIHVSFDYDYDSRLYMIAKDPEARNWKVIVHCSDGEKFVPEVEKFCPWPGCETHEGEAAWYVDHFQAEKIEIQLPDRKPHVICHPDQKL